MRSMTTLANPVLALHAMRTGAASPSVTRPADIAAPRLREAPAPGLRTRRCGAGTTRRAARSASGETPDREREILPDGAPADEAGERVEHQGCGARPEGGVVPASGDHVPDDAEAQVERECE